MNAIFYVTQVSCSLEEFGQLAFFHLASGHEQAKWSEHAFLWDDPNQDCDPRSVRSWCIKEQMILL